MKRKITGMITCLILMTTLTANNPANAEEWTDSARMGFSDGIVQETDNEPEFHDKEDEPFEEDDLLTDQDAPDGGEDALIASGDCGRNTHWKLDAKGVLTIGGYGEMTDYYFDSDDPKNTKPTAPWFVYRNAISDVVIEEGVTSIGNYAFIDCQNLTRASVADSVLEIGNFAFSRCRKISESYLPDTVTDIGYYAFSDCVQLVNIHLPEGLNRIKDGLFDECTELRTAVIPDSVETIGEYAFGMCSSLEQIAIPGNVKKIANGAWQGCTNLKNIYFEGDAPGMEAGSFQNVVAFAYYPAENPTWTKMVLQNYGGRLTWTDNMEEPGTGLPVSCSIRDCDFYGTNPAYTGKEIKPKFSVYYGDIPLHQGMDYEITGYKNNIMPGTAKMICEGKGRFSGTVTVKFRIEKRKISSLTLPTIKEREYTGKNISPVLYLKNNGKKLVKGKDYKLTYKNNRKIGTAGIVITGMGNYTGTKTIKFKIIPAKTAIQSISRTIPGRLTISWNRAAEADGYILFRATAKNGTYKKIKSIQNGNILSYTDTGLKKDKTYFYMIKTYKQVGKTKYYGKYSSIKSGKVV